MLSVSPFYSIPYIAVLLILLFLYSLECKPNVIVKKRSRYAAFIVLLVFIGLRGHLYTDFSQYYLFYDNLPVIYKFRAEDTFETFELGYSIYSSILKTFIPDYFVWVFFNTLIDLLILFIFFKRYSNSVILSFIVFFAFQGLYIEFNLYRNVKALCLFLLSIRYLQERKATYYFLLNILGSFMHTTSIFYLLAYFFLHKEFSKKVVWGLFVAVNVLFILDIHFTKALFEQLASYYTSEFVADKFVKHLEASSDSVFSFGYFERTTSFFLFVLNYKLLVKQNVYNRIFCNSFILYYFVFYLFGDIHVFLERIPLLFIFSYWVLYPNLIKIITTAGNRKTLLAFIIILSTLKVFITNRNIAAYYDNVIWGTMSYEKRVSNLRYLQE